MLSDSRPSTGDIIGSGASIKTRNAITSSAWSTLA
jgi:hypothetical protein